MRPLHKLLPGDISTFSGEVVETDYVEEVSGQMMNGSGSTWTDVHRELWIRPAYGTERSFTFKNVAVLARKGHRVTVVVGAGRPVAFVNFSTEQYVNLVTPHDFELFGATEALAFAALLVAVGLTGLAGLIALLIGAATYGLLKWSVIRERHREASEVVDEEIRRAITHPPVDGVNDPSTMIDS